MSCETINSLQISYWFILNHRGFHDRLEVHFQLSGKRIQYDLVQGKRTFWMLNFSHFEHNFPFFEFYQDFMIFISLIKDFIRDHKRAPKQLLMSVKLSGGFTLGYKELSNCLGNEFSLIWCKENELFGCLTFHILSKIFHFSNFTKISWFS